MLIRAGGWGVASRDGDKDLRESDDVRAMGFCQLWAESLFLYRWGGALCCAGSGVGTRAFLQRQHAFTAHQSLGRNTLNPHRSSSPFPESSRKHSINLMQAKTERGVGGDGGDGSVHGGGRPG